MAEAANARLGQDEGRAVGVIPTDALRGEALVEEVSAARAPSAFGVFWLLTRREAAGVVTHLLLYLVTAAGLAVSSFLLQDQLAALQSDGPQALDDPLAQGLWVASLVLILYLGLAGTASLARERERGTLEVLFYGPVTALPVVLSRFGGMLAAYVAALMVAVPYFAAVSWLSGFAFSAAFAALLPLAVVLGGPALALGVLVSCMARRLRGAIILFAFVVAALLAVDLGQRAAGAVTANGSGALAYGRLALATLAGTLGWLSPFAYLSRLSDPFTTSGVAAYVQAAAGAALYTVILLAVAVATLGRQGVRP